MMKVQVPVTLHVTCLDTDGNHVAWENLSLTERDDLMGSLRDAVDLSLREGEGSIRDGLRHHWSHHTSVQMSSVAKGIEVPPPIKRPFNDMTMVAVRKVMIDVVRMIRHLGLHEVVYFLDELRAQLMHVEVRSETDMIRQAIDSSEMTGVDLYAINQYFKPEEEH